MWQSQSFHGLSSDNEGKLEAQGKSNSEPTVHWEGFTANPTPTDVPANLSKSLGLWPNEHSNFESKNVDVSTSAGNLNLAFHDSGGKHLLALTYSIPSSNSSLTSFSGESSHIFQHTYVESSCQQPSRAINTDPVRSNSCEDEQLPTCSKYLETARPASSTSALQHRLTFVSPEHSLSQEKGKRGSSSSSSSSSSPPACSDKTLSPAPSRESKSGPASLGTNERVLDVPQAPHQDTAQQQDDWVEERYPVHSDDQGQQSPPLTPNGEEADRGNQSAPATPYRRRRIRNTQTQGIVPQDGRVARPHGLLTVPPVFGPVLLPGFPFFFTFTRPVNHNLEIQPNPQPLPAGPLLPAPLLNDIRNSRGQPARGPIPTSNDRQPRLVSVQQQTSPPVSQIQLPPTPPQPPQPSVPQQPARLEALARNQILSRPGVPYQPVLPSNSSPIVRPRKSSSDTH